MIGVTGASGVAIAQRVVEAIRAEGRPVALVISHGARAVVQEELGVAPSELERLAREVYPDTAFDAAIASGSSPTRGMAIVPCSASTVGKLASGIADTLITRAAHVHLKERRPLVIVPRETPMSTLLLRQLAELSGLGVVVLPAAPAFYLKPKSVRDVVDYLAGKVLDHLGVPHRLYVGWKAEAA
ncbi:MAG TPA: UbiX family flavin prenyltransferase [Thermoplasmata archaeon]|nr:UbiX family flavin prenyltransferase [Thermoplasmata archaeon]